MSPLDMAIGQIRFARQYTESLLADIEEEMWLASPPSASTHVAWQVGHLAMAQYALTLLRIRGKEREDQQFITNRFFKYFKKGSQPSLDLADGPSLQEIRTTFDAVHQQALREMPTFGSALLDEPLPEPHAVTATKLGSLFFCASHEMLHAGQIGLLRRLLGKDPVR